MSTPGQLIQTLADRCELPVAMKEMRSRMRGNRAPITLFVTTGLVILIGLLIANLTWGQLVESRQTAHMGAQIGRTLFATLVAVEAIICWFIAPALTAGAISLEREQQTLEMLLLTRLSAHSIVLGKLLSSLGFIVVILLCSLPIAAVSFLFGGVAPAEIAWAMAVVLSTTIFCGAVGLYCSTTFQKTSTALVVAYTISLGWVFGLPALVFGTEIFGHNSIINDLGELDPMTMLCVGLILLLFSMLPTILIAGARTAIFRCGVSHTQLLLCWIFLATLSYAYFYTAPWSETKREWTVLELFSDKMIFIIPLVLLLLYMIVRMLTRNKLARRWSLLVLALLCFFALAPWNVRDLFKHNSDALILLFTGNSPLSLMFLYFWTDVISSPPAGYRLFVQYFIPITVALQLLLAWAYLTLACRRVVEMRREQR